MPLRRIILLCLQSFSCVYFWKTQSTHNNFSARMRYSGVTRCVTFSFYFCIFKVFLKIYRKLKWHKKNQKTVWKSGDRGARAVARKAAPLCSEPQWRLWEERTEHREQGSSSQSTAPQRPGRPPASHRTPSPSSALLGLRVFICENTCRASLGGILWQLNELQQRRVLWNHHKNKDFSSLLLLEVLVRDLLYS